MRKSFFTKALVAILVVGSAAWFISQKVRRIADRQSSSLDAKTMALAREVSAIESTESKMDATIWRDEQLAQECGKVWEQLWNDLNASTNALAILAGFQVETIAIPVLGKATSFRHQIQRFQQTGTGTNWTNPTWREFIETAQRKGWQLVQSEFRHLEFRTDEKHRPKTSRYYVSAHLVCEPESVRAIVEGELIVAWGGSTTHVHRVEPQGFSLRLRPGEPGFHPVLTETVQPAEGSYFIDPVLVYDLDGDGADEIVLAAKNAVYAWNGSGSFSTRPLCRYPPGLVFTAIFGDFDGDGAVDFLCAKFEGLYLFKGNGQGLFEEPGQLVWPASQRLRYAQALTCGDIDGDGDLDVWLGQYKVPYDRGQMPAPYYDANDGYPSYLLLNDGHGRFSDVTTSAGLAQKRWRRTYSASFIDLNEDGHLDLLVVSDFAGADLYLNDGRGRFQDRTRDLIPEWHAFGMSQVCADFNQDGLEDIAMIGMTVPVAERLQRYGRARPGFEDYLSMAGRMAAGNRLLLGQTNGTFVESEYGAGIARSGWSWGCSALDFDNDGYPDLYVANGHETKKSVQDYETEFWLHDIYVGNSRDNLPAFAYFQAKSARTRGQGISYGGYEKNRLFWNQDGKAFLEIGHLMGVAVPEDSRNVVAADVDRDGRLDLIVTTFEVWPQVKQSLRVFLNRLASENHWIGIRLRESGHGKTPVGARVRVTYGARTVTRHVVSGDSYRAQSSPALHFGLGTGADVTRVEVHWANGRKTVLEHPAVDRVHAVAPPEGEP